LKHQVLLNRLGKDHSVDLPVAAVREPDPIDSLVRRVTDGLVEVLRARRRAHGLHLHDGEDVLPLPDRQISVVALDAMLACHVLEGVPAERFAQDGRDDGPRVGLVRAVLLGPLDDARELAQALLDALSRLLLVDGHSPPDTSRYNVSTTNDGFA